MVVWNSHVAGIIIILLSVVMQHVRFIYFVVCELKFLTSFVLGFSVEQ